MSEAQLPVPVLNHPHWRVNLRSGTFSAELVESLSECYSIIEKTRVRLGGWEYPYLNPESKNREQGNNWVASWIDFAGHMEYWRLYQSGQFLHLFAIRECLDSLWRRELDETLRRNLSHKSDFDWSEVTGFVDIQNLNCTISEIFEFAARLTQRGIIEGTASIGIEMRKSRGLLLATSSRRLWNLACKATEENMGRTWEISGEELVGNSAEHALCATKWFLERFGWMDPNMDSLKKDQERFLKGAV